jgi:hypothetical protein
VTHLIFEDLRLLFAPRETVDEEASSSIQYKLIKIASESVLYIGRRHEGTITHSSVDVDIVLC